MKNFTYTSEELKLAHTSTLQKLAVSLNAPVDANTTNREELISALLTLAVVVVPSEVTTKMNDLKIGDIVRYPNSEKEYAVLDKGAEFVYLYSTTQDYKVKEMEREIILVNRLQTKTK